MKLLKLSIAAVAVVLLQVSVVSCSQSESPIDTSATTNLLTSTPAGMQKASSTIDQHYLDSCIDFKDGDWSAQPEPTMAAGGFYDPATGNQTFSFSNTTIGSVTKANGRIQAKLSASQDLGSFWKYNTTKKINEWVNNKLRYETYKNYAIPTGQRYTIEFQYFLSANSVIPNWESGWSNSVCFTQLFDMPSNKDWDVSQPNIMLKTVNDKDHIQLIGCIPPSGAINAAAGAWHHIAITVVPSRNWGFIEMWLDGVSVYKYTGATINAPKVSGVGEYGYCVKMGAYSMNRVRKGYFVDMIIQNVQIRSGY